MTIPKRGHTLGLEVKSANFVVHGRNSARMFNYKEQLVMENE